MDEELALHSGFGGVYMWLHQGRADYQDGGPGSSGHRGEGMVLGLCSGYGMKVRVRGRSRLDMPHG